MHTQNAIADTMRPKFLWTSSNDRDLEVISSVRLPFRIIPRMAVVKLTQFQNPNVRLLGWSTSPKIVWLAVYLERIGEVRPETPEPRRLTPCK